ncbi:MAG TPA: DUF6807 family protein [Cyclobacteriaceae bacterium]|nr:DUF6807 family protein [Cyclobacteriaceae bacterium]
MKNKRNFLKKTATLAYRQRKTLFIGIIFSVTSLILAGCGGNGATEYALQIDPSQYSGREVPVHAKVTLAENLQNTPVEELAVTLQSEDGGYKNVPGQIIEGENGQHELWWILPESGNTNPSTWTATVTQDDSGNRSSFQWEDTPGQHLDLLYDGKRVFRYDYALDDRFEKGKTLTARNRSFYEIYDLEGENKITNDGAEGTEYPHHRGIMIGARRVGFEGAELSFWGMEDLTVQRHIEFRKNVAGPVLAHTEALIQWNDSTGRTIIEEVRQARIFKQAAPNILVLDFTSDLKAVAGPVTIDGDPDHGGVQFRAHNDVAAGAPGSKKATYHSVQNIDSLTRETTADHDLPWVAMDFGLNNKTYSVLQMDHPENPGAMWSAYRDYGRFGPFFQDELDENETLTVQYRFWISESEMPDREVLSSMYESYTNPVDVQVK